MYIVVRESNEYWGPTVHVANILVHVGPSERSYMPCYRVTDRAVCSLHIYSRKQICVSKQQGCKSVPKVVRFERPLLLGAWTPRNIMHTAIHFGVYKPQHQWRCYGKYVMSHSFIRHEGISKNNLVFVL
jgi:hypothetical protein